MKGIHFGSYWMGSNDVVYLMAQELKRLCDLVIVDTKLYSSWKSKWVKSERSRRCEINWLKDDVVFPIIERERPDFVVCNAGGLSFTSSMFKKLRNRRIVTVGITLSDPDVFQKQGRHYARLFDLFYTNSRFSIVNQYRRYGIKAKLLQFAASPSFHRPLDIPKIFDVIVVGHARPDRRKLVKQIEKSFSVGVFGRGWNGVFSVHDEEHVKAINKGKIYLSFPITRAGYFNVKVGVFEAIACRSFVLTRFFEEMENYFNFGTEVVGYNDPKSIFEILKFYLDNPKIREWVANNAYGRLLNEHTWEKRWLGVLNDVKMVCAHILGKHLGDRKYL